MILLKHSEHFIPVTGMTQNGDATCILYLFSGLVPFTETKLWSSALQEVNISPLFTLFFQNCPQIPPIISRELMQKTTQFNTNKQLRQPQGTFDRQTKILITNCFSIGTNKAVFFHSEPHLCLTELNFSAKISLT